MVVEFKLPDPGEGISEGNIVKWRVKEGDQVKEHDIIADIETDKAVIEIPCPVSGSIKKLHFKVGETVEVGQIIVTIDDKSDRSVAVVGELEEATDEEEIIVSKKPSAPKKEIRVLPSVRKLAEKMNVDIEKIQTQNGIITEKDVKKFALQENSDLPTEIVPIKGIRKVTAEHMVKSERTAVHVSHFEEINVTELSEYREREKIDAKKKGIKLTYLPFIVRACVLALRNHPYLNAFLNDEKIYLKKYYNIGIAVDTSEGLIVPNIKNAGTKNIETIAREISDLADKAKNREISLEEMKDGTFTITNIGALGGTHATPIINYPESAILGLGAIRDKPIVEKGEIVIAKILPISVTFDHRILDGAECARFANDIKKYLENYKLLI